MSYKKLGLLGCKALAEALKGNRTVEKILWVDSVLSLPCSLPPLWLKLSDIAQPHPVFLVSPPYTLIFGFSQNLADLQHVWEPDRR